MADKLADKIYEKALPVVQALGYDLADMELVKEGPNWYLRFFIEHSDPARPVDIGDCERVSQRLSGWLDETDPIPQAYFLEVSSPGIERPLKKEGDFIRFQGSTVRVKLFTTFEGEKSHSGLLGPVSGTELILRREGRDLTIPRELISGVHLEAVFTDKG